MHEKCRCIRKPLQVSNNLLTPHNGSMAVRCQVGVIGLEEVLLPMIQKAPICQLLLSFAIGPLGRKKGASRGVEQITKELGATNLYLDSCLKSGDEMWEHCLFFSTEYC